MNTPNMIPVLNINTIDNGDRLFYELGYKINSKLGYDSNWAKTGNFKEIDDVMKYITEDKHLSDIEYLKHHNFMIIKK
jgi:hypothetical protein